MHTKRRLRLRARVDSFKKKVRFLSAYYQDSRMRIRERQDVMLDVTSREVWPLLSRPRVFLYEIYMELGYVTKVSS
jgi:hypothetical protein